MFVFGRLFMVGYVHAAVRLTWQALSLGASKVCSTRVGRKFAYLLSPQILFSCNGWGKQLKRLVELAWVYGILMRWPVPFLDKLLFAT